MKKIIIFLVVLIVSLNTIAFAKIPDLIEGLSFDEEILYTYWVNNRSEINPFGVYREPTGAFLADIDNDAKPELIVFFSYLGPGGPTFSIYKNNNENVWLDGNIITSSGTGIHHDLQLALEINGNLKIIDHYVSYPYEDMSEQSVTLSHYISGNTVAEQYADVYYGDEASYSTDVTSQNRIYCTKSEADKFFDDFYAKISQNIVFSSDIEFEQNVDFFGIWNMQKQLRQTITVLLDDQKIIFAQSPIIVDGRTLVPLRAIFEKLGATVNWDGNTQTVTSTKGQTTISLSIGKAEMYKNGELIMLDVVPQLIGDRTLVPIRAVAEGLGCKVDWDGNTKTVIIRSN